MAGLNMLRGIPDGKRGTFGSTYFSRFSFRCAGAHGQASLIVYTTPEHVQAPVAAAGQITTAGDARQLQLSLKVVF